MYAHMAPHQERRKAPRALYDGPVIITTRSATLLCKGVNLSESGMSLVVGRESPRRPGTCIRLKFTLPGCPGWISIKAVIVRRACIARCIVLGIQFLRPISRVRRILRTYVFVGSGEVREFHEAAEPEEFRSQRLR